MVFINDNDNRCIFDVFLNFIKSFCYMCSPVEHYFCFYSIFFLYDFEDVPQEKWFSALCPVKTLSCVPDRVVCLHNTCP